MTSCHYAFVNVVRYAWVEVEVRKLVQITLKVVREVSTVIAIQAQVHRRWGLELENLWGLAFNKYSSSVKSTGSVCKKELCGCTRTKRILTTYDGKSVIFFNFWGGEEDVK